MFLSSAMSPEMVVIKSTKQTKYKSASFRVLVTVQCVYYGTDIVTSLVGSLDCCTNSYVC